jgi:hypothetical protein
MKNKVLGIIICITVVLIELVIMKGLGLNKTLTIIIASVTGGLTNSISCDLLRKRSNNKQ